MKFIDLFAGVGGFRLGMERAGHECVWSCEIDKWCKAVYKYHWEAVEASDARGVRPEDIPDFDCLCAGFPCQSFSVAGKRGGFKDTRGTLFYEICRIARVKRPPLLLLENVKGLLSADDRRAFAVVLESLGELGYDAEWQVLNSKDFGVPQNRPRVFIVGHLGGFRGREVFPVGEGDGDSNEGDREAASGKIANTLSGESAGGQNARGNYVMVYDDYNRTLREDGIVGAVRQTFGRTATGNACKLVVNATNPHSLDESRRFHFGDEVRALKCPSGNQDSIIALIQSGQVRLRRPTPIECERLQGFPDDWTRWGIDEKGERVEISDAQRYRMMGNAVTVNVVEFIAERLPKRDYFTELGDHLYGEERRSIRG